jgi:hypothetical protein
MITTRSWLGISPTTSNIYSDTPRPASRWNTSVLVGDRGIPSHPSRVMRASAGAA